MSSQESRQLGLFDRPRPLFDGRSYSQGQDKRRLQTALDRVVALMSDGRPRTIPEIAEAVGCSETSASARLRDLRKERFAVRYSVAEVLASRQSGGLWFYSIRKGKPE